MEKIFLKRAIVFNVILLFCAASISPIISGNITFNFQYNNCIVESDLAFKVAQDKIFELEKETEFSIKNYVEIIEKNREILCYVFNLNPQGYIVVSANFNLPPVLAYSFTSNAQNTLDENNALFDLLKTDLSLRLKYVKSINSNWNAYLFEDLETSRTEKIQQWPSEGSTLTGGWLETKWHQNAPYNNFCPIDPDSEMRSIAGCPAVAMAQILNYHQTINNVFFDDGDDYYHNYENFFWIDDDYVEYDFLSYPQLNSYLDTLVDHYKNQIPLTDNDKGALTFACGVAAKQVYTPSVSGTFGVNQAYDAYQKFNFTTIELLDEDDADLYERLTDNMINGLPAHIAVVNEDWTVGHNIVVDGYNTDDFYHINFGWGGSYDGWYLLPQDMPFELTVIEGVIVDIIDENTGSNLQGHGVLSWVDVEPETTLNGSFSIENVGNPGYEIDWEILTWPDWGVWTITPNNGEGFTPEDGKLTIDVSVVAPENKKTEYSGYIKIVNKNNYDDSCLIHISLVTKHSKSADFISLQLCERFPRLSSTLTKIMNNRSIYILEQCI